MFLVGLVVIWRVKVKLLAGDLRTTQSSWHEGIPTLDGYTIPSRTTQETMVEIIAFVGIYVGRIHVGCLRWCETDFVHPQYDMLHHNQLVQDLDFSVRWFVRAMSRALKFWERFSN